MLEEAAASLVVRGGSSFSRCQRRFHSMEEAVASLVGGVGIGCRRRHWHRSSEEAALVVGGGRDFGHHRRQWLW